MALCTSNQQSDSTLQQSVLCKIYFVLILNRPNYYKLVKVERKHNYVCLKKSVFGLFIGSWSIYPYMYVGLLCDENPTSTYQPCNAYPILTGFSMWFECVELGWNRFVDLWQYGWTHLSYFVPNSDTTIIQTFNPLNFRSRLSGFTRPIFQTYPFLGLHTRDNPRSKTDSSGHI